MLTVLSSYLQGLQALTAAACTQQADRQVAHPRAERTVEGGQIRRKIMAIGGTAFKLATAEAVVKWPHHLARGMEA
jgi:hypothetical protein